MIRTGKRIAAALGMIVCLTACADAGNEPVVSGTALVSEQENTGASVSETASEAETTAAENTEDVTQIYYSYADLLKNQEDAIDQYTEARDKAGAKDTGKTEAAVCNISQDTGTEQLIYVAQDSENGDGSADGFWISVYTHEGNRNRRIGHFKVFDGSRDSAFCAFQDADSSDFCLFTEYNDGSDRIYTYTQYELSGDSMEPAETVTKREHRGESGAQTVTYTRDGQEAQENDFYKFRGQLLSGIHQTFIWNFRGNGGDPWDTFLRTDSIGLNYDDMMFYLDHTYIPKEDADADSTEGLLFPDSDRRYIFNKNLENLSDSDIQRAVNEIYARHGMKFNDSSVTDYFSQFPWYDPEISEDSFDEDSELNEYERANVAFMVQYMQTKDEAAKKASEEAAKKASEEAAKKASEEAAKKASEEAAKKASEEAARKASEEAARQASAQAAQQQNSGTGSGSAAKQTSSVSLATALSRLQSAVGTSVSGHTLQYEFTATVNDASGRQYYAFTVTRMEGGAWVFYHNYLVAVDGTQYGLDSAQSGRPGYQHGSIVSPSGLQSF